MAGHALRMKNARHAYVAMKWTPETKNRRRGRPKSTWRRTFQKDLKEMDVLWNSMEEIAAQRELWRTKTALCATKHGKDQGLR